MKQTGQADINYTYDNADNLHTEQGAGGTVTYSYDNANEVLDIVQSANNADEKFNFTNGRPTTVNLPGSITETIGYDQNGRETSITATKGTTTLTSFTGSYTTTAGADSGLMQSVTNGVSGVTTKYSYDGLNRLTGASGTGTGANSYTYTYDSNGNRTQTSTNGVNSPVYGFNADNELTTSGGTATGNFDQAGNQTVTGANLSLFYNAKNQTNKFITSNNTTYSTSYTDGDQQNRTQFGSTTEQNGILGLYSDMAGTSSTYYTHLPSGTSQAISELIGTTGYYYLTDLQGSTIAVTDSSGNVKNTYSYDPYGNTASSTGTTANPYKYDDGYQDPTGLYKFGQRYYNPTDARWTQLDPSGQNPGYIFAGDDPINQQDPTGLATLGGQVSGCFFICLDVGLTSGDNGDVHFSIGYGLGLDVGVNAGEVRGTGDVSTGLTGNLSCAAGPVGGGLGTDGNGQYGGAYAEINYLPTELGCEAGGGYTF